MQQHRVPIRLGTLRTAVRDAPAVDIAVHTIANDSDAQPLFAAASAARVCRVCALHAARYTCPRCNAPYCSSSCYKRHGDACTEPFFEAHVRSVVQLENAGDVRGDARAQRSMNDMLERVKHFHDGAADAAGSIQQHGNDSYNDETNDDDEEEEALIRLEQLALADDAALTLDALTPQQRKQFLAEVADGRLGKFIALWQPWWRLDVHTYERETNARRRQLVIQEISSNSKGNSVEDEDDDEQEQEPTGPVVIEAAAFPAAIFTTADARTMPTSLDALLGAGRAPSPLLRLHLIEILFSYALVMRTFNGEWKHDPVDAVTALLHLATVLTPSSGSSSGDATFQAIEHVLQACLLKRMDADTRGGSDSGSASSSARALNAQVATDVKQLLHAKTFVLDALSDARTLVAARIEQLHTRSKQRSERKRLVQVDRKLLFFLTFVFHLPEQQLRAIASEWEAAMSAIGVGSATR